MVLAPDHAGYLHQVVVDDDGVVIGEAVALYKDDVLQGVAFHLDVPVDEVVEGTVLPLGTEKMTTSPSQ